MTVPHSGPVTPEAHSSLKASARSVTMALANFSVGELQELLAQQGSPLFVVDEAVLLSQLQQLRSVLGEIQLFYSMKANPSLFIIRQLQQQGVGFEVGSGNELRALLRCGIPAQRIFFTAPGKTAEEIELALNARILAINVESEQEFEQVARLAEALNVAARVTLRIHQNTRNSALTQMSGRVTQFGLDPTTALRLARNSVHSRVELFGLHTFFGSRVFDWCNYVDSIQQLTELAREVEAVRGQALHMLGFGGGFGMDPTGARVLDLARLKEFLQAHLIENADVLHGKLMMMESGTFIALTSTAYVCTVTYTKTTKDTTFVVTDGGTHHRPGELQTSSSFASLVRFVPQRASTPQNLRVVGKLCTPLDVLNDNWTGSVPLPGDLAVYPASGAYALHCRNSLFLSHDRPAEVALTSAGEVVLTRRRRNALDEFDFDLNPYHSPSSINPQHFDAQDE